MAADVARILVCEDSRTYAHALRAFLERDDDLRVVGICETAEQLLEMLPDVGPDLVTMDIELPGMDGLAATERIMAGARVPILVLSAHTGRGSDRAGAALAAGALDAMPKSELRLENVDGASSVALRRRVKRLARARMGASTRPRRGANLSVLAGRSAAVIGICSSTGGPQALHRLLSQLPADFPIPLLVVQHMAPGFLDGFVSWLGPKLAIPARVASVGARPEQGVSFAPSGSHLVLGASGRLMADSGNAGELHRPSGDALLHSLAVACGSQAAAIVLTGLGSDGAAGLRAVAEAGGVTIAQDAESSVVYGMPRMATEQGAALAMPPADIGACLLRLTPAAMP